MGLPVAELLARITSSELTEWMAYERVAGTLGPERDDLHAGIVAATVANVNRGKGKRPAKVSAFMPKWDRRQSWEEQLAIVRQLNTAMGGTDRTTRR